MYCVRKRFGLGQAVQYKLNCNRNSTDMRIAKPTAKFHELGNVLRDKEKHLLTRRKLLEACVRPLNAGGLRNMKSESSNHVGSVCLEG